MILLGKGGDLLQEEVENKSVNLVVTTTKLSARVLYDALKEYTEEIKVKYAEKEAEKKTAKKDTTIKGKQTVKELIGQGQGVSSMPIGESGIKDFQRIANKYGLDFAIVKDKTEKPPKYMVFFKAKDADAITSVLKEYSAKQLKKHTKNKKPSLLQKLKKFKEMLAMNPQKERQRKRERER